jgi:hypothetical protein
MGFPEIRPQWIAPLRQKLLSVYRYSGIYADSLRKAARLIWRNAFGGRLHDLVIGDSVQSTLIS